MDRVKGYDKEPSEAVKLALYIRERYLEYRGNTDRRIISPIKLQKSLYFLFAYWGLYIRKNKENTESVEVDYSNYNEYLFEDKIEAWTYGPVIPEVFLAEKSGQLDAQLDSNYLSDDIVKREFIDNLLDQLFEIDDFGLVRISHEDECWKKNYIETDEKHNREILKEDIINEYISKQVR